MRLLLSAIVPVRNGEEFLRSTLDSILEQCLPEYIQLQLSIYNDGSIDNTEDIIKEYIPKFSAKCIQVIYEQSNLSNGVAYAKNRAVLQSSGEYLCFCDADDLFNCRRIFELYEATLQVDRPEMTLFGSMFTRSPSDSTMRYTNWANNLNQSQLYYQAFTANGPTVVAPTWFMSRHLFDRVGGFYEDGGIGYPEDLRFFLDALELGCDLYKVEKCLVTYRYHSNNVSLSVSERSIWRLRLSYFEKAVLGKWPFFSIWNAGKEGKRFFRSLNSGNKSKVIAFCDVDPKKISRGQYNNFDSINRKFITSIPIISYRSVKPPVVICVKLGMTRGIFEKLLSEKHWIEGIDFFHFG